MENSMGNLLVTGIKLGGYRKCSSDIAIGCWLPFLFFGGHVVVFGWMPEN
jgi:hypothetical protein